MLKHFFACLMTGFLCVTTACSTVCVENDAESKVKYVIVLIGDGFGANQRTVAETSLGTLLRMNSGMVAAPTDTNNVDGRTTDSAASGTAIACGIKTYNGAIGVDPAKKPVESLAAYLKRERGFSVGIISNCALSDATPAAQYAHQEKRSMRKEIIGDLAKSNFDFFGGAMLSSCNIQMLTEASQMPKNETDFRKQIADAGYTVYAGKSVRAALAAELERIRKNPASMKKIYAGCQPRSMWDDGKTENSITAADYLTYAANAFAAANPEGFFIMLECGWTDHAGHNNDAGWMVREVFRLDDTLAAALEFQKAHPQETLIVVTADHETGGLQIADPEKLKKNAHILLKQKIRKDQIGAELQKMIKAKKPADEIAAKAKELFGFDKLTDVENDQIKGLIETNYAPERAKIRRFSGADIARKIAEIRDAYAGIKYTTGGHSGAKIITNAFGPGAELFSDPELKNSTLRSKIEQIVK